MEPHFAVQYLLAAAIGGLVGSTELFTRYRDSPGRLLRMLSFHGYWAGNAAVSCLGLLVMHTGLISVAVTTSAASGWLIECLVAGFGSMLLLRSALLVVRVDNGEQAVGPAAAVSALLQFIEEIVRRNQAAARSSAVAELMRGLDYSRTVDSLPPLCLSLMANTSQSAAEALAAQVDELRNDEGEETAKTLRLGAILVEFCGKDVLAEAIRATGTNLRAQASSASRSDE